ncbi:hypothetical protein H0H92_003251 [Tricholoma furcatifolium]|nr:hypothetical protein H0H92_003251 [Tricholoma furcatifolium]
MSYELTSEEIRKVAREALIILREHGFSACLVGGAACHMYGMKHRYPKDVDIVVMTNKDPEEIKRLISDSKDNFELRPSINPANTYKVMWYALGPGRSCKVDILVPDSSRIPMIPAKEILCSKEYPDIYVPPFLVVLLLKLKAWNDHRLDDRSYMREKVPVDVKDIEELLEIGKEWHGVHLNRVQWLPGWFEVQSQERVQLYTSNRPWLKRPWRDLGFST